MQELDSILDRVTRLPPAPRLLHRLLRLLGQPDTEVDELVKLLTYEPAMTASLLRLCNSAYHAPVVKVLSLDEAILRLGFRQVYQLVIGMSCAGMMSVAQKGYGLHQGELWKHSMACALAATAVAQRVGYDPQAAFTAGLLHDLGKLVLSEALAGQYDRLIEMIQLNEMPFAEAEKMLLGADHAQVGGRLLQRWGLPERLITGVAYHHAPAQAPAHRELAAQICLANLAALQAGGVCGLQSEDPRTQAEALRTLGLTVAYSQELAEETRQRLLAEAEMLKLAG